MAISDSEWSGPDFCLTRSRENLPPDALLENSRVLVDVAPLAGFAAAAEVALHMLQDAIGLDLWLVTQLKGDEQVAIAVRGDWLPVPTGAVFPWVESFCRHMVAGTAPRIAPRCADIPAYAAATAARDVAIGAYVGVPIVDWEGRLFGTICGVAAEPGPDALHRHRRLLDSTAQLLSTLLAKEQLAADRSEAAAAAYALCDRDPLTGLLNNRGWDYALAVEQQRQARDGGTATLLALSASAGDPARKQPSASGSRQSAADVLAGVCRPYDRLARLDDTLAVLAVDCDGAGGAQLADRLQAAMEMAGLTASVRYLRCPPGADLRAGWQACLASSTAPRRPLALPALTEADGATAEAAEMVRLRADSLRILHVSGLSRAELLALKLENLVVQPDGGLLILDQLALDAPPGHGADAGRGGMLLTKPEQVQTLLRYRDVLARRLAGQARHPSAPPARAWPLFPVFAPSGYVTPVRLSDRGLARVLYAGTARGSRGAGESGPGSRPGPWPHRSDRG